MSRLPKTGELSVVGDAADSETVLNRGIPLLPDLAALAPSAVLLLSLFIDGLPFGVAEGPLPEAGVEKIEPLRKTGPVGTSGEVLMPEGRGLAALTRGDDLASEGIRDGVDAAEAIAFVAGEEEAVRGGEVAVTDPAAAGGGGCAEGVSLS